MLVASIIPFWAILWWSIWSAISFFMYFAEHHCTERDLTIFNSTWVTAIMETITEFWWLVSLASWSFLASTNFFWTFILSIILELAGVASIKIGSTILWWLCWLCRFISECCTFWFLLLEAHHSCTSLNLAITNSTSVATVIPRSTVCWDPTFLS